VKTSSKANRAGFAIGIGQNLRGDNVVATLGRVCALPGVPGRGAEASEAPAAEYEKDVTRAA
jgi:hypothetical protein